jgi:hypothetical protein
MRLIVAYSELQDALEEEAGAKSHIIRFSKAFGPSVWREGHPLDIEKVNRLRRSRWRLRGELLNLDYAMRCEPAEGRAC